MVLSPNKRIICNAIFSYIRSFIALVCALLTGRWALMALGEIDYGLVSLVGGLTIFITFIESEISGAIGRFYAFSVGEQRDNPIEGMNKCLQWFNSSLLVICFIPVLLVIIGYPIGEYAVRHWLAIPLDRIDACIWVWRFSCITCFISMIVVPFNSFFYAKQLFGIPTFFSIAGTVCNVIFVYYMVCHPGDWLAGFAAFTCIKCIVPSLLMMCYAAVKFPECRYQRKYLWSWDRTKQLLNYSGWTLFGCIGGIGKNQLMAILVNKYFGVTFNATMAVGNNVGSKCTIFSGGISSAIEPAIVNACGAGERQRMQKLSFAVCKFSSFLFALFALPISLELQLILKYWLVTPPRFCVSFCYFTLISVFFDFLTLGHMMAIHANGKIAIYQTIVGGISILAFPLSWLFIILGFGFYSVGIALVVCSSFMLVGRLVGAHYLIGYSIRLWLRKVCIPLLFIFSLSYLVGLFPRFLMSEGTLRCIVTVLSTFFCMILYSYCFLFDSNEKKMVLKKITGKLHI